MRRIWLTCKHAAALYLFIVSIFFGVGIVVAGREVLGNGALRIVAQVIGVVVAASVALLGLEWRSRIIAEKRSLPPILTSLTLKT